MVVALELLVQDADAVPKLGVFDVLEGVQGSLVGVEGLLEVFDQEVAVTKSCPGRTIFLVDCDELNVVLNGSLVLAVGSTVLGKLVDAVNIHQVVALSGAKVGFNNRVICGLRLDVMFCLRLLKLLAYLWNIVNVVLRILELVLLHLLVLVLLLLHVLLGSAHAGSHVRVVLLLLLIAQLVELLEKQLGLKLVIGIHIVILRTS